MYGSRIATSTHQFAVVIIAPGFRKKRTRKAASYAASHIADACPSVFITASSAFGQARPRERTERLALDRSP